MHTQTQQEKKVKTYGREKKKTLSTKESLFQSRILK